MGKSKEKAEQFALLYIRRVFVHSRYWLEHHGHYGLPVWHEKEDGDFRELIKADEFLSELLGLLQSRTPHVTPPSNDGRIDTISRKQAAKILGVSTKTLANRAKELPDPVGRGGRGTPVYEYGELRSALVRLYPEKEFLFPDNFSDL
jgi:hypothetical protein